MEWFTSPSFGFTLLGDVLSLVITLFESRDGLMTLCVISIEQFCYVVFRARLTNGIRIVLTSESYPT